MGSTNSRSKPWSSFGVLIFVALVAVGCGGDDAQSGSDDAGEASSSSSAPTTSEPTTTTTATEPEPDAVDYSRPGPYPVGRSAMTLEDRPVVVFYPADETAVATAERYPGYSTEIAFPEAMQPLVPDPMRQSVELEDVFVDPLASQDGPFPIVIHSHGDIDAAIYHSVMNSHLASWGFVVAAPEHLERGLGAFFLPGSVPDNPGYDIDDVERTVELLTAAGDDETSSLHGQVDSDVLALTGYSQGARTVVQPDLGAIAASIVLYAPSPFDDDLDEGEVRALPESDQPPFVDEHLDRFAPPAGVPALVISGDADTVAPPPWAQSVFEWLDAPKRHAVLADGGHGFARDLCGPIQEIGGLSPFADQLPLTPDQVGLLDNGCTSDAIDAQLGYDIANHLTVAFLLDSLDLADSSAALTKEFMDGTFPGGLADLVEQPGASG